MVDSPENHGELGGYPLRREIDTGPGLTIYESEDGFGRSAQVHCFDSNVVRDRIGKDKFFDEVRKSASVAQESSGLLLDMGEKDDQWFVVFLVPDAPNLRTLILRGGKLAEERVRVAAEGATAALVQLHAEELRHGDIRPETIFLSGGNVSLGPRRLVPLTPEERNPHYLSPEEMRGEAGDIRSDLFALAEVLYEAVTGRPALPHRDAETALALLRSDPPALPADAAPELAALVSVLLSEDPDDRPTDPGTVARVLSGEITLPPPRRHVSEDPAAPDPAAVKAGEIGVAARPPKGGRGRLHVPAEKGIACFDIFEDQLWIGPGPSGSLTLASKEDDASAARVETGSGGNTIFAIPDREPHVRINGSLIDVHLLEHEDIINVGDAQILYERLKPEPTRTAPARPRPPPQKKDIRPVLVTFLLCLLVVGIGVGRLQRESGRGEDSIRKARELVKQANESEFTPSTHADEPSNGDAPDVGPGDSRERRLAAAREAALTKDYREMVAEVRSRLEEDAFFEGHLLYKNFSDDHEDTRFADRARGAANDLLELIEFRFEEDRSRVLLAMAARDFEVVEGLLDRIEIYGAPAMRSHAATWRGEVDKLLHETQIEGGGSVTMPGEGKIDPPDDPIPEPIPEPTPVEKDEEKAEEQYGALLKAMERQRWDQAIRLIDKLLAPPFDGTVFVARHREQIDRMGGVARLERDGYAALFRGEVKVGRGREVTITYRFDTAEEEEDWTPIKPFADPGTGFFEHQGDTMRGRGVGALVHSAVFEPGTLVMRARINAVKPTDFGIIFLEPRELMRYYLFTVQNRYFTIGARREKLEENVIWIFGGGAWADNPEGDIGFIRVAKSKTPSVTAGEWIDLEGAKVDDRVTMKIGRAPPLSGSAQADDRYKYPALRPGLYILKSEVIVDEVVLRGVLDEGWAEGAMQKARDRYR